MDTDIKDDVALLRDKKLLELLLTDRTVKRHIVWATNDYRKHGECFAPQCQIMVYQITGANSVQIRPRIIKAKEEQNSRTREKAEVFTPSWICNAQNNLIDTQWFDRADVFNTAEGKKWTATDGKIVFPAKSRHSWQDYVRARRMEMTCGEAPYLVSRYDAVSGKLIRDVHKRIGLLDRKLRVIDENTDNEADWMLWVKKAYQSVYGFEYQGDNLLLARENLLFTFADYMQNKFHRQPTVRELRQIAYIISWNIWQMDGLTCTAPYSETAHEEQEIQHPVPDEKISRNPIPCVIKNWTKKCCAKYRTLVQKEENILTFEAIVGNPPYQIMDGGAQASARPVYHLFIEQAEALQSAYISMIMPARWYSGGKGLDNFREKMLKDTHLRQLHDFVSAKDCFAGVDIKGGICYFLWDAKYSGNCLVSAHENSTISSSLERPLSEEGSDIFIRDNRSVEILRKVRSLSEPSFASVVHSAMAFGFRTFFKTFDADSPIAGTTKIYANHAQGYILTDKIKKGNAYIDKWKVYIPEAIGSGDTRTDVIHPILGEPNSIATETYIMNGPYASEEEARNAVSYIHTKFFHFMLGLRKLTQHTTQKVYQFIPLQDFTGDSDIDWHTEQSEIDNQLYQKYKFSLAEISYIENTVQGLRKKR